MPNQNDYAGEPTGGDGQANGNLVAKVKTNLVFRSKWAELNGAMGDLGTFIPIIMTLSLANDLNLGTTLVFTGIYNILTGALYGVPMPVQPMKSIAAVAISSGPDEFGEAEIMAAGILTAGIVFVLGVTGLMRFVYRFIPLPVVRGIQLAQGLSFALTAVKYVKNEMDLGSGKAGGRRPWLGLDGLLLALVATCFIVIVNGAGETDCGGSDDDNDGDGGGGGVCPESGGIAKRRKWWWSSCKSFTWLPSAVMVFLLGVVLAVIRNPTFTDNFTFGLSTFHVVKISRRAWREGFIKGTVPQLPLTVLNSVVAVCRLTSDLFPDKPEASATSVSVTVGLMNLVGCWFGAMPSCHGAGGLAGQYKFGGRSGGCVAVLGAAKLVVGVVFGSSLLKLFVSFPVGLLGVLLLFAGVELAMASRDMGRKEESFVLVVVTAVSMGAKSAALGFVGGMVVHVLLWGRNALVVVGGVGGRNSA